jgi:uncharacterized membrane protein YdjX (TVP38/TMEM64 family)
LGLVQKRQVRTSAATVGLAVVLLGMLVAWAIWSYRAGGLMQVLIAPAPEGETRLEALRVYILGWGMLAPVVYVSAVIVEVLVAPVPGPLLYAPAGAIFGGLIGGTLSLIGNVAGAGIACWIGHALGESWVARHTAGAQAARIRQRVVSRGSWVIFLLRINPLTSSDLVSYVAGAMGVPVRDVVIGTLAGMAPIIVLALAAAYLAIALWLLLARKRSP